ncbi:WD40/YVTN repeat-like containing protein [Gracilaria domingensis]|nr:WD40/YVTN repeat-like containing protein [Gracilaria domingensis]
MVGAIATSSSRALQVRFKSGIEHEAYKAAHNVLLQVPAHFGRKSLRTLLHTLLSLPEEDRPDFHFLIDDAQLRTTLDKYLERRNLSFENTLIVTYYLPIPEANSKGDKTISENWISSLDADANGRVLAGLFSGRVSILHQDEIILNESKFSEPHKAPVKAVQWLDNDHFLTVSSDETACVWRFNGGDAELVSRMDTSETKPASFSAASVKYETNIAALGCVDGSIWLTQDCLEGVSEPSEVKKRKSMPSIPASRVTDGTLCVSGLVWRDNEIVSVGWDGFTNVFNAETCMKATTIPSGGKALTSVATVQSGDFFVVSAVDGAVRMVDGRSGKGVVGACGKQDAHRGIVTDVTAEEMLIVSTGVDGCVKFWDRRSLLRPQQTVRSDGKLFAVDIVKGEKGVVFAAGQTGTVLRLEM